MIVDTASLEEIAAHPWFGFQPPKPPSILDKLLAAASPKQWSSEFGVYLCPCNMKMLPLLQMVHLIRGDIQNAIDMWQGNYHPGVGASAGSHDKGGPVDVGQLNDRCLKTQRECGIGSNHRLLSQGFVVEHNHMFPIGCPHGSPLAMWQQTAWQNGRNGLVSNAPITGPGPIGKDTPHWTEGVRRMEAEIMSFADEVANKVQARIGRFPTPADIWNWAGINVSRDPRRQVLWSGAHTVSHTDRAQDELGVLAAKIDAATKAQAARDAATAKQIADLKALVNGLVAK
jgi:hypothetical protein